MEEEKEEEGRAGWVLPGALLHGFTTLFLEIGVLNPLEEDNEEGLDDDMDAL